MSPLEEADFGVIVWTNPRAAFSSRSRYLVAVTGTRTGRPLARPLLALRREPSTASCAVMLSGDDVSYWLNPNAAGVALATEARPVIVPIPLARAFLGWEMFEISSK